MADRLTGSVLCVGHAAFDSVYRIDALPERPTKVRAIGYDQSVGGMAANAACVVAALGSPVRFLGPIGDDENGDRVLTALARAGVAIDLAFRVPGARTSHSAIIVERNGERLIISHHGDALRADAPPFRGAGSTAAVLIDVRWVAGARAAARHARDHGLPLVLDGEMGNPALLAELASVADHVIFSEPGFAEWRAATGAPASASIDALLRARVSDGATLAAVTQGERGVVWAARDAAGAVVSGHQPAFAVDAVETLGAGDAFHGAYALALTEGKPVPAALRFAAAAAALRCTRTGGNRNLPRRDEVAALLAAQPL